MRFERIIGGTEADVEQRFPWLKDCSFRGAVVDITKKYLVWQGGVWQGGKWQGGVWQGGIWHDGIWEGGIWHDGIWEGGAWQGGIWHDGIWEGGIWQGGRWHDGIWEGGAWLGGHTTPKCGWRITCCENHIQIGCEIKTIKEWDEWFAGDAEFETKRGTEAFKLIYANYLAVKAYAEALA